MEEPQPKIADSPPIYSLSNELLEAILNRVIEEDREVILSIDRRAHLSVESFNPRPPRPPERAKAQEIAQFRLVCRWFGVIGVAYQFTRVALRFNKKSFQRLEKIASTPSIADKVKRFIYLVPCFYQQGRVSADFCENAIDAKNNSRR
jgi:hypothetical protein